MREAAPLPVFSVGGRRVVADLSDLKQSGPPRRRRER
jgi:hypothetical protein